jgi:uncharacterized membrane protein YfcA
MSFAEIILLAGLIVLLGHFIKGMTGFASALFSIPLLALFLDIKFVVPVFLLFDLISGVILTIQTRRSVDRESALLILSGLAVGTAVGTYLLVSFGNEALRNVFGVLVVLFALKILIWDDEKAKDRLGRMWGPVAGLAGGCTGAMFGLNGPPLVVYLVHRLRDKRVFRATLYAIFFVDACYRLILYSLGGLINTRVITFALYLTPFLLVGIMLGSKLHVRVRQDLFRRVVALVLVAAGALLIIR